jgi:spermidine/putrescine-binding protein
MDAIQTKKLSATNTRGTRIKATLVGEGSITVSYNYAISEVSNHRAAALALLEKLHSLDTQAPNEQAVNRWRWKLATGVLADGSYAHVWTGDLP